MLKLTRNYGEGITLDFEGVVAKVYLVRRKTGRGLLVDAPLTVKVRRIDQKLGDENGKNTSGKARRDQKID